MSEDDPGELSELSRRVLQRARDGDPPAEALAALRRSVLSAVMTGGGSGGGPAAHPAMVTPPRALRAPMIVGSALLLVIVGAAVWVARGTIAGGSEHLPTTARAGATIESDPPPSVPAITPHPAVVDPPEPRPEIAPRSDRPREPAPDRDDEGDYVESIRRAVDRDPSRALRMSRRHAALFPRGLLDEEVAALEVESLARSGRHQEARALADAFFARHPESAYRRRIHRALAAIRDRE